MDLDDYEWLNEMTAEELRSRISQAEVTIMEERRVVLACQHLLEGKHEKVV